MDEVYFRVPLLRIIDRSDSSECVSELQHQLPLANKWDAAAQYRVAQILGEGLGGGPADLIEAAKWIDLATRKYHQAAAVTLQAMIDKYGWDIVGEGKRRAFRWQQEHYNAQAGWPAEAPDEILSSIADDAPTGTGLAVGIRLNDGNGLPADYEKAVRFFRFGAERDGCIECTYRIGYAYYQGKGIKADPVQAADWLKLAAKSGHREAILFLGVMAARGHGVARDTSAALYFLQQAERAGQPDAATLIRAINDGVRIY